MTALYNSHVSPEEVRRLQALSFPNQVSTSVLARFDLNECSVLDVGCGPKPDLGVFVMSHGGTYLPVDGNPIMIEALEKALAEQECVVAGQCAEVDSLPLEDQSVQLAHVRFVLEHLSAEKRVAALHELQRVARKIYILQYDWSSISSSNHQLELSRCLEVIGRFTQAVGIDIRLGEYIEELCREVLPEHQVTKELFSREEGDHTDELLELCRASAAGARHFAKSSSELPSLKHSDGPRLTSSTTTADFLQIAEELEQLVENLSVNPIRFVAPSIAVIEILRT